MWLKTLPSSMLIKHVIGAFCCADFHANMFVLICEFPHLFYVSLFLPSSVHCRRCLDGWCQNTAGLHQSHCSTEASRCHSRENLGGGEGRGEHILKICFLAFLPLLIVVSEDRQERGIERRGETRNKGRHERDPNTWHAARPEPTTWHAPGPPGQRAPRHTSSLKSIDQPVLKTCANTRTHRDVLHLFIDK